MLVILSGPSGSGKSSVLKAILSKYPEAYFSVSTTTRAMREGEKEGVNYFYVSKEEFQEDIKNDQFLEWAKVHDNYYGTSIKPIKDALNKGKLVLLDIDVQGHDIAREKLGNLVNSIFITTPDAKTLSDRLSSRQTDKPEVIKKRLENAKEEMQNIYKYDYLLINENLDQSIKEFDNILISLKHKITNQNTCDFLKNWSKENF